MTIGVFLSPGDSLTKQQKSGQLDRLIKYYLIPYSKNFNKVYLFTYGHDHRIKKLPKNIKIINKPKLIPYQLYQFVIPFIHSKTIKKIDVFRVFQTIGGIPVIFINKPSVVTYGYHYHQFAQVENHPIKAKLIKLIIKPVLKKATKIIVTSRENQKYLTGQPSLQSKIAFIPNGVDPLVFKPNQTKSSIFSVLTIGRLTHQKNHKLLIKFISRSKFKSKIKLRIIGVGPLKQEIIQLARVLNVNLQLISNLSHQKLASQYQRSAIFCLTSIIEGHPKVLLEAMSSGCACLTTNFEGNLIINNITGLIGQNQKDLTKKLDDLIERKQLRNKLTLNARKTIIKNFNLNKLVTKEIDILQSINND